MPSASDRPDPSDSANSSSGGDGQRIPLDPKQRRRALSTVAFTLFLDLAGFGMILPVLPYYAEHHGASATEVAVLATAFSLAQFIVGPFLGRLSDRYGRRPVMLISIAGSVASALVLGWAQALWMVFLARLVAGSSKANISTAHAYVADVTAPDERARYMGMMGAAMGMGFVCGPAIGGLLSVPSMPTLPFFASAGLAFINLMLAFRFLPETHHYSKTDGSEAETKTGAVSVVRHLWGSTLGLVILINFATFFAFSSMESTFALYNEYQFEWGARETGYILTFTGAMMVVTQGVLVGLAVRKLGEVGTLAAGLVILSIGLATLGMLDKLALLLGVSELVSSDGTVANEAIALVIIGNIGFSAGYAFVAPSISSLISRLSDPNRLGWNMGLRESASALARITGPLMAGPLFQYVGIGVPMTAGACFTLVAVGLTFVLARRLASGAGLARAP